MSLVDDLRKLSRHRYSDCAEFHDTALGDEAADEIERLQAEVEALKRERDSFHMDYRMKCDEETKRLSAEVEALRRDAERYRWLRDSTAVDIRSMLVVGDFTSLDGYFDSAMLAARPGDPDA